MRKTILFFTLCLFILFSVTCKKDQSLEPQQPLPTEPVVNSSQTNSQGVSTLSLAPYQVQVTVKDQFGAPVPQILVEGFLLDGIIVVVASDTAGHYYPSIEVVNTAGLRKTVSNQVDPITIAVTIIWVGSIAYQILKDFEIIRNNGWIEKICYGADLEDVLNIVSSTLGAQVIKKGVIVELGGTAASRLGISAKQITISAEALRRGSDVFITVLSQFFHVLDQDRLRICFYTPRGTGKKIPLIYIEDVELRREFQYKFILTWGQYPEDLDSHLWTPSIGGSTYHVYFANKGSLTSPPFAALDVDDVTSYGPENITIKALYPGTYKFAIHHYDGSGTITTSSARVKVFKREGLVGEYTVPTTSSSSNWWWYLGDINGSTGAFTLKNQVLPAPPQTSSSSMINKN
jgi:hypothetical protein